MTVWAALMGSLHSPSDVNVQGHYVKLAWPGVRACHHVSVVNLVAAFLCSFSFSIFLVLA